MSKTLLKIAAILFMAVFFLLLTYNAIFEN